MLIGSTKERLLTVNDKKDRNEWGKVIKSNESRLKDFQKQLNRLRSQLDQFDRNSAQYSSIKHKIDLLQAFLKQHPNTSVDVNKLNKNSFIAYEKQSKQFWKKADSDIKKCSISLRNFKIKMRAPKGPSDKFKPIKPTKDMKLKFDDPSAWKDDRKDKRHKRVGATNN